MKEIIKLKEQILALQQKRNNTQVEINRLNSYIRGLNRDIFELEKRTEILEAQGKK